MKWGALFVLIALSSVMLFSVKVDVSRFDDVDIVMEPAPRPGPDEVTPNSDCMEGWYDRWHDACNARQVHLL